MGASIHAVASAIALAGSLIAWNPAAAQEGGIYPSKAIRWVAPYPAGSPFDTAARKIAESIAPQLKVPVIVENKPGAGASIGAAEVARSKPDGYTILVAISDSLVATPATVKVPYDPQRDFTLVGKLVSNGAVLLAHPSTGVSGLRELIETAKGKQEGIPFGACPEFCV